MRARAHTHTHTHTGQDESSQPLLDFRALIPSDCFAQAHQGAQFTCVTSSKVQMLTQKELQVLSLLALLVQVQILTQKELQGQVATEYYFEHFVQKNPFGIITDDQVGWYKSTNTDAAAGTKAQTLTQLALPGAGVQQRRGLPAFGHVHLRAGCG